MKNKKSWKTSLGGVIAAIGLGITGLEGFDIIGILLAAVGNALMGLSAQDSSAVKTD